MHISQTLMRKNLIAASLGAASVSAWMLSGAHLPFDHIESGLNLLSRSADIETGSDEIQSFFAGGQDFLASLGANIASRLHGTGQEIPESATAPLGEMSRHIEERREAIYGWTGRNLEAVSDHMARVSACTAQGPHGIEAVDAGKGFMDALYNVIKAWAVFSAVKKAFTWAASEVSKAKDRREAGMAALTSHPDIKPASPAETSPQGDGREGSPAATEASPGGSRASRAPAPVQEGFHP